MPSVLGVVGKAVHQARGKKKVYSYRGKKSHEMIVALIFNLLSKLSSLSSDFNWIADSSVRDSTS